MNVDITTVTPARYFQLEQEIINILTNILNTWDFKEQSIPVKVVMKEVATVCNTIDELAIVMLTLGKNWGKLIEKAPVG